MFSDTSSCPQIHLIVLLIANVFSYLHFNWTFVSICSSFHFSLSNKMQTTPEITTSVGRVGLAGDNLLWRCQSGKGSLYWGSNCEGPVYTLGVLSVESSVFCGRVCLGRAVCSIGVTVKGQCILWGCYLLRAVCTVG